MKFLKIWYVLIKCSIINHNSSYYSQVPLSIDCDQIFKHAFKVSCYS